MPTMTRKGQVTIPKKVRDAMGLVPGSHVEFVIEPNRVVLRKDNPAEPNGAAPRKGIPPRSSTSGAATWTTNYPRRLPTNSWS